MKPNLAVILLAAGESSRLGQAKQLVQFEGTSLVRRAAELLLTLEPGFFEKCGFKQITKESLPMKVWSDCAKCSKQDHCDEIAMAISIDN